MQDLEKIQIDFSDKLSSVDSLSKLEELRLAYLGKKGIITSLLADVKNLTLEEKKQAGASLNKIKSQIAKDLQVKKEDLEIENLNKKLEIEKIDLTIPVRQENEGLLHPLSKTIREIRQILNNMGFTTADGPEIEDDFHNFTAPS